MKSKRLFVFLAMAALGAVTFFGPVDQLQADDNDSRGHGRQIAGSYLTTSTIFLGDLQGLITFGADGGYTWVNTASAGLGGLAPWASRPEGHGTWKRTGNREITGTDIVFDYDDTGTHVSTPLITRILTFDRRFETFVGTLSFKVFNAGDDPLDPSSVPFTSGTGTITGKRIPATMN